MITRINISTEHPELPGITRTETTVITEKETWTEILSEVVTVLRGHGFSISGKVNELVESIEYGGHGLFDE